MREVEQVYDMKYSALIGNPTGHSVSHILYGELAKSVGLRSSYQHIRVDINRPELGSCVMAFHTLRFIGLSVTLPYKVEVVDLVDELDVAALEIGAVNTIKLGTKRIGYNTDWRGITRSIERCVGPKQFAAVTIFGTGGAARAAIYASKQLGAQEINVLYRQPVSRATQVLMTQAGHLGIRLHQFSEVARCVDQSNLIINATSAGMIEKDPLPFDLDALANVALSDKVFLDAVFNPLHTPLLEYFRLHGATGIDGLGMMIYQGIDALSIWLDCQVRPSDSDLQGIRQALESELAHV